MNEKPETTELKRAIELVASSREASSEELARRVRGIEEAPRRGKTWDETKREILGHLS